MPFLYASSASVYGGGREFREERAARGAAQRVRLFQVPVRPGRCGARCSEAAPAQIAGFRYFNVYGPREAHKGRMASVAYHFYNQYRRRAR